MSFRYVIRFSGKIDVVAEAVEIFTEGKRNDLLRNVKGITPPKVEWTNNAEDRSVAEVSFNSLQPIQSLDFSDFEKQYPTLTLGLLSFDND